MARTTSPSRDGKLSTGVMRSPVSEWGTGYLLESR
jgi:hypothetical protein